MNSDTIGGSRGLVEIADSGDVLRPVYETLGQLQDTFYQQVLKAPYVNLESLPLVSQTPAGIRDRFALDINYYFYPYLFVEAFPGLSTSQMNELCIVAQLYAEYLIQLDKILDEHLGHFSALTRTVVLLGGQRKHFELTRRLNALFPPSSPFWQNHEEYFYQYLNAELCEKAKPDLSLYTTEEMEIVASGKTALTKIITAGMATLSGKLEALDAMNRSQDLFAVGYQLYDDVKDWRKDYEHNTYSQLLRRAIALFEMQAAFETGERPSSGEFGRRLHLSGLLQQTLESASHYFELARLAANAHRSPRWLAMIDNNRQNVLRLRADLAQLLERAVAQARVASVTKRETADPANPPRIRSLLRDAIRKGVAFLQAQQGLDYVEAAHLELVPKKSQRGDALGCSLGTVFQRALVLEALSAAKLAGLSLDEETFQGDLQRLIDLRLRNRRGGWNYFPAMEELPPDCDDLAQVLHVLWGVSHPRITELCENPIALALAGQHEDGRIDTWIADPTDSASLTAKHKMYAIWGDRADVEVMANFLLALHHYDHVRFAEAVRRGASFIARKQHDQGYWPSTWYPGPFYGTWVCTRLLAELGHFPQHVARARRLILETQKSSGGWGEESPTTLDTAYAMLTVLTTSAGQIEQEAVLHGVRYLLVEQRGGGSWPSSPFIKMEPIVTPALTLPGYHEGLYGSGTVSTAYAIRALLAARAALAL